VLHKDENMLKQWMVAGLALAAFSGPALAGEKPKAEEPQPAKTTAESGVASGSTEPDYALQRNVCDPVAGRPEIMVHLKGLDNSEGNVRVNLYGDNPDDFLERGKKIARVQIPARQGDMDICLPAPVGKGLYAVAVLHDKNKNHKLDYLLKEGYGFSNNPKLFFGPPKYEKAAFPAGEGLVEIDVNMSYFFPSSKTRKGGRHRR